MKKGRKAAIISILLIVIIGGSIGGYFFYESTYFFATENAQITADNVTISPLVSGNVMSWTVKEGDDVKAGQILGRQDIGTSISSSEINVKTMDSTASALQAKADIKSPIDGKVVVSNVVIGEALSPGMQAAIVADTNNMYIKANIEETSIFKIKAGQTVDITIDAYPGKKFTGYVLSVSQATQNAFSNFTGLTTSGTFSKSTQLIPVKITIVNNENLPFLIGMNATVKIHVK